MTIAPPPRSTMTGMAYFDIKNALFKFTAITSSHSSSEMVVTVP
jgi:hypothetical protein